MSALCGTVKWTIADDDEAEETFLILNTFFVLGLPVHLLSPQHLAQVFKEKEKTEDGTCAQTFHNRVTLVWNDHSRQQTVFLNNSNVPVFCSASACNQHASFKAIHNLTCDEPCIFQTHFIPLDEDDNDPVRFLTYLITALKRISGLEPEIGVDALQMAQAPQPPPPAPAPLQPRRSAPTTAGAAPAWS